MDTSPAKTGAHTMFKDNLKAHLHKRVEGTVRTRSGLSWDERMEKSIKGFQAKARLSETEQKKTLTECVERGRSRKTSAPFRSASETPNQNAMLLARKKKMHELELEYRGTLEALRDKMEKREPLFRLSEVNAAFAMQKERMQQRKREMVQDEHERWEHLRSVEENAASRPLLIEDAHYKAPKKEMSMSKTAPDLGAGSVEVGHMSKGGQMIFGGREEYEKDVRIREAISQNWYKQTAWAKQVAEIHDRANNRQKLHEITYPNRGDAHALSRARMMHALPAQVRAVY